MQIAHAIFNFAPITDVKSPILKLANKNIPSVIYIGNSSGFEKICVDTNPPRTVKNHKRFPNADKCTIFENSVFSKRASKSCVP